MGGLRISKRRQGIAVLLALPALSFCASAPGPLSLPALERPLPPGAVRVRLAFPDSVDLDLYVTGPSQETVYFGNLRAADGGALDADRRCESTAPAIETVTYFEAQPGVYRVGIDFPERCLTGQDHAPYLLEWEADGQPARSVQGQTPFGHLEVIVTEFSVLGGSSLGESHGSGRQAAPERDR